MKVRTLVSALLLLGGFGVLVSISGAPLRVHAYRGAILFPPLLAACLIYWSRSLTWLKKAIFLVLIVGLGALLATYAAPWVFLKVEINGISYLANLLLLSLGSAVLILLTNLFTRFFLGKTLDGSTHGKTPPVSSAR